MFFVPTSNHQAADSYADEKKSANCIAHNVKKIYYTYMLLVLQWTIFISAHNTSILTTDDVRSLLSVSVTHSVYINSIGLKFEF